MYGAVFVVLLLVGGAIAGIYFLQMQQGQQTDVPYVTVVGVDETSINITLTQMLSMSSITRNSSYENSYGNIRGYGLYTGVKIADLINRAGGMNESQFVKVTAADDYSMTFEYSKVHPDPATLAVQGEMILAYEYNGTRVPDYEEGFRIAFLPDDGYYSNADANATTDPNPYSAGPQWVSNVVRLSILETVTSPLILHTMQHTHPLELILIPTKYH